MAEKFEHNTPTKPIGSLVRAPNGRLYLITAEGAKEINHTETALVEGMLEQLVKKAVQIAESMQGPKREVKVAKEGETAQAATMGGPAPSTPNVVGTPQTGRCVNVYADQVGVTSSGNP